MVQGELHAAASAVGDHDVGQWEQRVERDERLDARVRRHAQVAGGDLASAEPGYDEHVFVGERVECRLDGIGQVVVGQCALGERDDSALRPVRMTPFTWPSRAATAISMASVTRDTATSNRRVCR